MNERQIEGFKMYKTTRDENSNWQTYEENKERLGSKLKIEVYFDLINTQQCFDERNTQDVKTFEEKKNFWWRDGTFVTTIIGKVKWLLVKNLNSSSMNLFKNA